MHQSFEPRPMHPPRAWQGHSLSVSGKASEGPRPWVLGRTNQIPVCVESAVTAFLNPLTRP